MIQDTYMSEKPTSPNQPQGYSPLLSAVSSEPPPQPWLPQHTFQLAVQCAQGSRPSELILPSVLCRRAEEQRPGIFCPLLQRGDALSGLSFSLVGKEQPTHLEVQVSSERVQGSPQQEKANKPHSCFLHSLPASPGGSSRCPFTL